VPLLSREEKKERGKRHKKKRGGACRETERREGAAALPITQQKRKGTEKREGVLTSPLRVRRAGRKTKLREKRLVRVKGSKTRSTYCIPHSKGGEIGPSLEKRKKGV